MGGDVNVKVLSQGGLSIDLRRSANDLCNVTFALGRSDRLIRTAFDQLFD